MVYITMMLEWLDELSNKVNLTNPGLLLEKNWNVTHLADERFFVFVPHFGRFLQRYTGVVLGPLQDGSPNFLFFKRKLKRRNVFYMNV